MLVAFESVSCFLSLIFGGPFSSSFHSLRIGNRVLRPCRPGKRATTYLMRSSHVRLSPFPAGGARDRIQTTSLSRSGAADALMLTCKAALTRSCYSNRDRMRGGSRHYHLGLLPARDGGPSRDTQPVRRASNLHARGATAQQSRYRGAGQVVSSAARQQRLVNDQVYPDPYAIVMAATLRQVCVRVLLRWRSMAEVQASNPKIWRSIPPSGTCAMRDPPLSRNLSSPSQSSPEC